MDLAQKDMEFVVSVCGHSLFYKFEESKIIFLLFTVMQSCGGIVRDNGTYFVNPNHPDPYEQTGSCQLTVMKANPDVCQLR